MEDKNQPSKSLSKAMFLFNLLDYNCIKASDWSGIFKCPVITTAM